MHTGSREPTTVPRPAPLRGSRPGLLLRAPVWLSRLFRADRRAAPRWTLATGTVRIGAAEARVGDISSTGMRVVGYRGPLNPQDRFAFALTLSERGEDFELEAEAVVAWRSRQGMLGAAFYALAEAERVRLQRFLDRITETP